MTHLLSMDELRTMQEADLLREIEEQRVLILRLGHAVRSGAKKDSHLLHQSKAQIARMLTVLQELRSKKDGLVPAHFHS